MAKKQKTLLLRNTTCDFVCPWINKLDGSDNHSFAKGEIFEVPVTVKRVRMGKEVEIDTLELLQATFGRGIEEAKGAISMSNVKEKDDEIARLKAELAKAKGGKKNKKEEAPEDESESEETENAESEERVEE